MSPRYPQLRGLAAGVFLAATLCGQSALSNPSPGDGSARPSLATKAEWRRVAQADPAPPSTPAGEGPEAEALPAAGGAVLQRIADALLVAKDAVRREDPIALIAAALVLAQSSDPNASETWPDTTDPGLSLWPRSQALLNEARFLARGDAKLLDLSYALPPPEHAAPQEIAVTLAAGEVLTGRLRVTGAASPAVLLIGDAPATLTLRADGQDLCETETPRALCHPLPVVQVRDWEMTIANRADSDVTLVVLFTGLAEQP